MELDLTHLTTISTFLLCGMTQTCPFVRLYSKSHLLKTQATQNDYFHYMGFPHVLLQCKSTHHKNDLMMNNMTNIMISNV